MLLEHLGEVEAGGLIGSAVEELLGSGKLRSTGTDSGVGTKEQGNLLREGIRRAVPS
jgi:hypothetical protein